MSFQAEIAQLVEHATENCGVASPILALGTRPEKQATCGRSTVVVRLLAKEKVVGPNPIARSRKYSKRLARNGSAQAMTASQSFMATSPSGKARVCKTLIMGSNPIDASVD